MKSNLSLSCHISPQKTQELILGQNDFPLGQIYVLAIDGAQLCYMGMMTSLSQSR